METRKKKRKGLRKFLSMETIDERSTTWYFNPGETQTNLSISPSPRKSVEFWSSESMTALDSISEDGDSVFFREPSFSGSYSSTESK